MRRFDQLAIGECDRPLVGGDHVQAGGDRGTNMFEARLPGLQIGRCELDEHVARGPGKGVVDTRQGLRPRMLAQGLPCVGKRHEMFEVEPVGTRDAADNRVDHRHHERLEPVALKGGTGFEKAIGNTPTDGAEANEDQSHGGKRKRPR